MANNTTLKMIKCINNTTLKMIKRIKNYPNINMQI